MKRWGVVLWAGFLVALYVGVLAASCAHASDPICGEGGEPEPAVEPDPNARVARWAWVDEKGYVGVDEWGQLVEEANPYCPGGPWYSWSATYATCVDPCTHVNLCTPATLSPRYREIPIEGEP